MIKQCKRCGKDIEVKSNSAKWCDDCRKYLKNEQNKKYQTEMRQISSKRGFCTRCYTERPEPGKKLCFNCANLAATCNYVSRHRHPRTPEEIERDKDRCKSRYQRLKAAGLCVVCGKKPSETGKTACWECRLRRNRICRDIARRKKGSLPLEVFRSGLFCANCGKAKPMAGKKVCPACYAKKLKALGVIKYENDESHGMRAGS